MGAVSYETNQYGVNLLRQGVNYGYDQGYRTGEADRMDRSPSNFETSFAYRDANYGYDGFYVDRDDYNFYFREGFRRGYEDGYGRHTNSACMPMAGARFSTPSWGRSSTSR